MSELCISYTKLGSLARDPYKKITIDAGFDLYSTGIEEFEDFIEYKTDIAFEIPVGYVGLLFPRSSVTDTDLMLKNCVGVIDASYRGEIKFRFIKVVNGLINEFVASGVDIDEVANLIDMNIISTGKLNRKIKKYEIGERIGQIVFFKLPEVKLQYKEKLDDSERGTQGFGHTGKN